MRRIRRTWFPGTVGLLMVLVLAAGCYRPMTTDVPPTPAAEEEQGTPSADDVIATSRAEATRAEETAVVEDAGAQAAEDPTPEDSSDETPTEAPPTAVPEEPTQAPEPTATDVPAPAPTATPEPVAPPDSGIHVVQAGETLFSIAQRYGKTVEAFVEANNLPDATHIEVGQELIIPGSGAQPQPTAAAATTYVVKRGDNLYRIALAFGLTYQELAQYNGITDPNDIYAGQVLRIPPR